MYPALAIEDLELHKVHVDRVVLAGGHVPDLGRAQPRIGVDAGEVERLLVDLPRIPGRSSPTPHCRTPAWSC
jgi:hypothetical protein